MEKDIPEDGISDELEISRSSVEMTDVNTSSVTSYD